MDTAGEGEDGINRALKYTLSRAKYMASGKLLYKTGSPAWHSVMTQRGRVRGGEEEGGDICIIIADSSCCMAETNTAA